MVSYDVLLGMPHAIRGLGKKVPDCDIKLVAKLVREKRENAPLALMAIAPNEGIDIMWSAIFKNNDIRSMIKNGSTNIYYQSYNSPQEVHVLKPDIEKVKEVLKPFQEP